MNEPLIARSNQSYWPLLWIIPALVLVAWGLKSTLASDENWIQYNPYGRPVDAWLPMLAFVTLEPIFLGCLAVVLWRRWRPRVELVIDDRGVTSQLLAGKGIIGWPAITGLEFRNTWLFVHGTDAAGKKRKLVVNLMGLDQTTGAILGAISARRPDLFPEPETP